MDTNPDVGTSVPVATPAETPVVAPPAVPVAPAKPVDVPAPPPVQAAPVMPVAPALSIEDQLKSNPDYQAYLDKVAGNVRKETREKARKDFLAELGADDLAKVKAALDAERARQEAEMTEAQRLQAQIEALNAEKQALAAREQATQERMKHTLLATEVEKQARVFKFIDPFDLKSRIDLTAVEIDLETGVVSGVAEQAKAIAAKAKHLIEHPSSPNPAPPTPQPASPQAQAAATVEEKRRKAWRPR